MAQPARQSAPEATASPHYFIRMKHPAQMSALGPLATASAAYRSRSHANIVIAPLKPQDIEKLNKADVEVIPSTRYEPLQQGRRVQRPLDSHPFSLTDVLAHTRASEAWSVTRGAGVHIAMVDTGICGTMPEFAGPKKSPFKWAGPAQGDPWTDQKGSRFNDRSHSRGYDKFGRTLQRRGS